MEGRGRGRDRALESDWDGRIIVVTYMYVCEEGGRVEVSQHHSSVRMRTWGTMVENVPFPPPSGSFNSFLSSPLPCTPPTVPTIRPL